MSRSRCPKRNRSRARNERRPRHRIRAESAACCWSEDHADTLSAASDLLAELECEVVGVASLQEALAAAQSQPFDLVISDLGLPDGSGLELMRSLRDRHGLVGIAVTRYGMEEDVRRSREAGFVDHLVKPITLQRLSGALDRFFAGAASAKK